MPSIFAVVIGNKVARSPSIYPDDPESAHYDPNVFDDRAHGGQEASHEAGHGADSSAPAEWPADENGLDPDGGHEPGAEPGGLH